MPSAIGEFDSKEALLAELVTFIHRYVDLSPTFEQIAAHYVLLSWVSDAFSELPYLRLRGDFGTGKTRALLAIGSLCYKPFFASGASTVSPIFHVLEAFGGTLVLDEADFRFSDATADLTKILNNGSVRGLPVLRTMTNRHRELNPQAFRVFGPKIIGMRHGFTDAALESRFITENTQARPLRAEIPIQVPKELRHEARLLRNKLLAWRFRARSTVASDPLRLVGRLSPRAKQTVLSLVSLIEDPYLREVVCSFVGEADEQLRGEDRTPVEQLVLSAILQTFEREVGGAPVGVVTEQFNRTAARVLGSPATPRWIGHIVRSTLGLTTVKAHGVYAIPRSERAHVISILSRYGEAPLSPESAPSAQNTAEA